MKILDDIWTSIHTNTKARINDPIIGTFAISWVLCNWDRIILLIWGNDPLEERVSSLSKEMALISNPSLLWINIDILLLPASLTLFYIFLLPKVAHYIDELLKDINAKRYSYSLETEIEKALKQKTLNKARLRADPNNEFLAQEVKIDLEVEKYYADMKKNEEELKRAEAEVAKNKELESKAKADKAKLDLEKKERQSEIEKKSLAISAAKQKALLASHRFPSAYLFLEMLSDSIKSDGVQMSVKAISNCIAVTFGYSDFEELLSDKDFSNDNLESVKYVLLDLDNLNAVLSKIIEDEDAEGVDSEWLIGHLEMIFDSMPYRLVHPSFLCENVLEDLDSHSYDLFSEYGIISAMTETNTVFDSINNLVVEEHGYFDKEKSFKVNLSGSLSGTHRSDSSVSGQEVEFNVEAIYESVVGKFGLSDYKINAWGKPKNYD